MRALTKKRLNIYPQDVERITGRSASHCRRLIGMIRLVYNKKKHQGVTVKEYCDYMGVEIEEVEQYL